MANKNNKLLRIIVTAIMIAITCVVTIMIRIPTPTKGYINFGDGIVLFEGWLLGPIWGTVAGGIGSALADFFSGYPIYIPVTFIIKAIMALIISFTPKVFVHHPRVGLIICSVVAEFLMVAGYYFYEAVIIGEGFVPALSGVFGNIMQGIAGILSSYFLVEVLIRTGIIKYIDLKG